MKESHGILIPGGFGDRGIEGKIMAANFARENKIPFLGRLFSNRTKVKDNRILLILVKPTIILQEEAEAEAIAAMEGGF